MYYIFNNLNRKAFTSTKELTGVTLADVAILESYLELLFATSGGFGIVKMC